MNINASLAPPPRFLMCRPLHFAVTYSINPWMDPNAWRDSGRALHSAAVRQWQDLHRALAMHGAAMEFVEPQAGLPDLVFTANAAVVLDGKALLARFRHDERRVEEPHFAAAFRALEARGLIDEVIAPQRAPSLEGAGDCLWDAHRKLFWMGFGFRSDYAARTLVEETFGVPCVPLALADPKHYHLDTAFCALPCGTAMYYPRAFSAKALGAIHANTTPDQRIVLDASDAAAFAANAVPLGRRIVLSSCSAALAATLKERGYHVVQTPLAAFLRSGGSACCLTLRLDHRSVLTAAAVSGGSVVS
ncbi:MAG TPA: arginine deiminase-related protein [Pseudolabrys sp.]|nr:arginine deiminase-related protein [Pseudolabrys sp.]